MPSVTDPASDDLRQRVGPFTFIFVAAGWHQRCLLILSFPAMSVSKQSLGSHDGSIELEIQTNCKDSTVS